MTGTAIAKSGVTRMREDSMKSVSAIVGAAILALSCAGCGADADPLSGNSKADAEMGKADGTDICLFFGYVAGCDLCAEEGWYGDGECDDWLIEDGICVGPDPDCGPVGPCRPECRAIGSRSEGWYDSCTDELIGWAPCDGCEAQCDAIGSRSEGWYDSCGAGMNGAGLILWAECAEEPEPEPEICPPICDAIGSRSEGWYNSCTDELIGWMTCSECDEPRCDAVGSRSEGWYTSEGCGAFGDDLIGWDDCAPEQPVEPEDCHPICDAIGSRSEGWYHSCSGELIGWMTCSECDEPRCDAIGSRSEGWYTSEGCGAFGGDLIGWDDCSE